MIKEALSALRKSERPVIIYGAGIRLADAAIEARMLASLLGIPVAPTWGAQDLFPETDTICVGGFGTHGTRAANFVVQNADWILSVGSRLDSKATGTPRSYFARAASVFMADIDITEVRKFGGALGKEFVGVQADAKMFLRDMIGAVKAGKNWPTFFDWRMRCDAWRVAYPVCRPEVWNDQSVNPYVFVRRLSDICKPGEVIVSDTGLSLAWMMQAFGFKEEQRFVHAFNQTPMGYGLPAAIGAAFARSSQRVILVTGDGGFMLNIQELPVVVKHKLPIKIMLFNNGGHAMCRQTQEQWLGGKYYSTSVEGGLAFPDFCKVGKAYGLDVRMTDRAEYVCSDLAWAFKDDAPALLEIIIPGDARLIPQVQYGKSNEDGNPPLPRDELAKQMIVGMIDG